MHFLILHPVTGAPPAAGAPGAAAPATGGGFSFPGFGATPTAGKLIAIECDLANGLSGHLIRLLLLIYLL